MSGVVEARIVAAVLEQALSTEGTKQIFVFGPEGQPFWAARMPVVQDDLSQLDRALALIESMEDTSPKPFFGHTPERDLYVAALDAEEDLYVVVLAKDPDPAHAEARVHRVLLHLAPHAAAFRAEAQRRAAMS